MTGNSEESASYLTDRQYDRISAHLAGLADKLNIVSVILSDSGGRIISHRTSGARSFDRTILATLAASSFAAAREMACRVENRTDFKMILYEGDLLNLLISSVTSDALLVIVFEKEVAVGMVRLFAKKTAEALQPDLTSFKAETAHIRRVFNGQFKNQLEDELDRLFIETE